MGVYDIAMASVSLPFMLRKEILFCVQQCVRIPERRYELNHGFKRRMSRFMWNLSGIVL